MNVFWQKEKCIIIFHFFEMLKVQVLYVPLGLIQLSSQILKCLCFKKSFEMLNNFKWFWDF